MFIKNWILTETVFFYSLQQQKRKIVIHYFYRDKRNGLAASLGIGKREIFLYYVYSWPRCTSCSHGVMHSQCNQCTLLWRILGVFRSLKYSILHLILKFTVTSWPSLFSSFCFVNMRLCAFLTCK